MLRTRKNPVILQPRPSFVPTCSQSPYLVGEDGLDYGNDAELVL